MEDIINIIKLFSNKKGGLNTKRIMIASNELYFNKLIELTKFLPTNVYPRTRFAYLQEWRRTGVICEKYCRVCGKLLVDVNKTFCSTSCSNKDSNTIEKIKNTWYSKSELEKNKKQIKRANTNMAKYGVPIASMLETVWRKGQDTAINNYGMLPIKDSTVLEKRKNTFLLNWGGIGYASVELFNKSKATNKRRYDVEHYSQTDMWNDKVINTCISRYGHNWISQVPEINIQQQSGGYSWHNFVFPSGRTVRVQGYEPQVLAELVDIYDESDIVTDNAEINNLIGFTTYTYEGRERKYYPDIYIKSEKLVIEVKSSWTYNNELSKNLLKRQAILDKGYNFKFIVK